MINFDIAPLSGLEHTGWTFTTMRQRPVIVRYGALPDTKLLVSMYRQLSARTIRLRYGAPRKHLSDESLYAEMAQAVGATPTNQSSMVVTAGPAAEHTAVALLQLVPLPHDPATAEVALVVRDDYQREGIGRALCRLIGAAAYTRGIRRLQFDTLVENRPVMRLIAGLGMRYTADTWRGETRVILALE